MILKIFLCIFLFSVSIMSQEKYDPNRMRRLEEEVKRISSEYSVLKQKLIQAQKQISVLQRSIDQIENENKELIKTCKQLQSERNKYIEKDLKFWVTQSL